MGSSPSAEMFFGMTKWVPEDTANDIEDKLRSHGNVDLERCSAGFDDQCGDNPEKLVAAIWKPSRVSTLEYDTKITIPIINVAEATMELVAAWKTLGLKLEQPSWHLVASYG